MLSRALYEAFRSISSGVYSDGRPIPPWAREYSPALERDEAIWSALADVATFAVETSQQLAAMAPGSGGDVGGPYVVRGGDDAFNVFKDETRSEVLGLGLRLWFAVEVIVRRRALPAIPPLQETAA